MKVTFLLVGETEFPFVKEGLALYEKRLGHYIDYKRIELPIPRKKGNQWDPALVKEKEGELILKQIKPTDEVILLDEHGDMFGSIDWARFLERKMNAGTRHLIFVTGGAFGFSEAVYQRANGKLSLSKMTFSHQIIRLFFTEQLYRAFTILRGEPYHNE